MQNFLWPSEDLTSARYVKQAGTVITPDAALAPDNTMTADLVDMSAAGAGTGWYQISAIVGNLGTTITRRVWLKGLVGGEVVTLQDSAYTLGTKTVTLTNDWLPYTHTSTTGATLSSGLWVVKVSGNGYYAWGMSMVNANWSGDYAKTTTSIINTGRPRDIVLKQNLLPYSNAFVTNWTNTEVTTVANSVNSTAPDGTSTAVELKESASLSIHRVTTTVALAVIGKQYTFSVYLKKGTRNFAALQTDSGARYGNVNLTTGETLPGSTLTTMTAKLLTDGWIRVDITTVLTTGGNVYIYPATGLAFADITYQGVLGDIAMYIWQAQYVQANHAGDLQPTVGTAITNPIRNVVLKQNLLINSTTISTSTPTAVTFADNFAANPFDGATTACKVMPTAPVTPHYFSIPFTVTKKISTLRIFAKDYGFSWIRLQLGSEIAYMNITTGAMGTVTAEVVRKSITPVPNQAGWYECIIGTNAATSNVIIGVTNADGALGGSGDGVKGVAFYAPSLVDANWAGDYISTAGVAVNNPIRNIVLKQNLLTDPSDFSSLNWTKRGTCTVTPNQAISPVTGLMTADLITGLGAVGNDIFNANYNSSLINPAGTPFTASIYIKRVSTSGLLYFQNPVTDHKGLWTIDLAELQDDVWYRVTPDIPGFTEVNKFVSGPSTGILMYSSVPNMSLYVDNAQLVKANWAGDPQLNTVTSPIRNTI